MAEQAQLAGGRALVVRLREPPVVGLERLECPVVAAEQAAR